MRRHLLLIALLLISLPAALTADELTRLVERELEAQGYDPGAVDGEPSTETAIAISKFQAAHGLDVTGEVSESLLGVLRAAGRGRYVRAQSGAPAAPAPAGSAAFHAPAPSAPIASSQESRDLEDRQRACLEEKAEAARKASKKKRGFGRLARAAGRVARRVSPGSDLGRATRDVYSANATADDLSAAAKDLGLTEDQVEECRNPPA